MDPLQWMGAVRIKAQKADENRIKIDVLIKTVQSP